MAWNNISFAFGSTLTHSKMGGLQENFTALAEDATGSPTFLSRAKAMVTFQANGTISAQRGVSSVTHGATGQYTINPSAVFSVGTQTTGGGVHYRSVQSAVMIGFNVNVAYSDVSVRVLAGASATTTNSATFPMNFIAMNNSAKALEDVSLGHVVIIEESV
jgi:hypothetical protein